MPLPRRFMPFAACLIATGLTPVSAAFGQGLPTAAENLTPGDLDTEHLFGFTEGSDLGIPGEPELEWETTGRLGRRPGTFGAVDSGLALKVPLSNDFRLAPGVAFNAYEVGPPGGQTRTVGGLSAGFLETRLRLQDRREAPFGLTLNIVSSVGRIDTGSGLRASSYGTEAGLLADRELIPGKLVGAINLGYALAATRLHRLDDRLLSSGLEVSGALAYQVQPGTFLGGELRYLRAYDGLGLDRFTGEAVFLGPTLYASLSAQLWLSVAWSVQVAGRAAGEGGGLDLTNFDRHQARLRIGYNF
ncbi:hypothetical protein [Methylobacterium soli]|uniref:hypothetical protein n=1 Tax=Methylobacterium soli TaxID=553447 RepID=UPI001EE2E4AE|nr:hypothetical protein [Methylobacterium soli]GJE42683.1 hypothetical protein AEGHOMDF_1855 [Methylobacterium soli]